MAFCCRLPDPIDLSCLLFNNKNAGGCEEIRPQTAAQRNTVALLQRNFCDDPDIAVTAQFPEIADGSQVDICGVIPLHRKCARDRHVAQRDLDPGAPVTDIDKTYDPAFPDPEHLIQNHIRTLHCLERLAENDKIKRVERCLP